MRYISLKDVQPYFSGWFHYQRHFNRNYRSGKTFAVRGYFYIDFDVLERLCGRDDVLDASSDFYSHRQHVMIDALVLNGFVNDDGAIMTKAQATRRRADKYRVTMAKKEAEDVEAAPGEIVKKNSDSGLLDEFQREDEMKSEIPQDWNYYPHEGPKTR